jgi:prepilin-type N-terminal cleavage/methylation domain-containing protein/prepilin-type processing-associated H-X9-DG protein
MRTKASRLAFTLVELLVVIGIIAVLVGLITVAVQKVREQGEIAVCKNNLRQMGMGFAAHHDAKEAWPSGGCHWTESNNRNFDATGTVPADYTTQVCGWMYQLLPYIGETNVWKMTSMDKLGPTYIAIYRCPLVRPQQIFTYGQAGANTTRAMNTYVANAGQWMSADSFAYPASSLDGPLMPTLKCPSYEGDRPALRPTGRKSNVSDGLSNTLMVGEKYFLPNSSNGGTCNDDQGWLDGWDNDAIGAARAGQGGTIQTPRAISQLAGAAATCDSSFGSLHSDGLHALFCDGSVHRIGYDIDPNAWVSLLVANDGGKPFSRQSID